jgi:hypothetical protein
VITLLRHTHLACDCSGHVLVPPSSRPNSLSISPTREPKPMPGQVGTASGRSLATRSQMMLLKVGHGCCPTITFWAVAITSHSKGVSIGEQRYSVANVRASAALGLTLS